MHRAEITAQGMDRLPQILPGGSLATVPPQQVGYRVPAEGPPSMHGEIGKERESLLGRDTHKCRNRRPVLPRRVIGSDVSPIL
jgi:hypothetical protein